MLDRIAGVFRLDANTFEEIEHDQSATTQAATVVLAVALLGGIGGIIGALMGDGNVIRAFIGPVIGAFGGWLIWSAAVLIVGTSFFGGQADMGEMLRVVGFAYAPRLLSLFSFILCVGWIIALVGWVWSLVAMIVAVRQGLDVDTGKAVITAVIGWVLTVIVDVVLGILFGTMSAIGSWLTG